MSKRSTNRPAWLRVIEGGGESDPEKPERAVAYYTNEPSNFVERYRAIVRRWYSSDEKVKK
jgi:hypothetical protein